MNTSSCSRDYARGAWSALLPVLAVVVSACAASGTARAPARIEIQDAIGFTITEAARIDGDVRAEYEEALRLLEQGRHEEGIELLGSVAEQAPQLSAPRIDLGVAFHRAGDLAAAESALLTALELNPDHPVVHNELGIIYRKTARFAEARASYQAALAIYPNYHFARRNLAILCDLYLADPGCALENYEAYMAMVPGDDDAAMWIADLRNRIGH